MFSAISPAARLRLSTTFLFSLFEDVMTGSKDAKKRIHSTTSKNSFLALAEFSNLPQLVSMIFLNEDTNSSHCLGLDLNGHLTRRNF